MGNEVTVLNSHLPRHLQAAVICTQIYANTLYHKPGIRDKWAKQAGRKHDKRDAVEPRICLRCRSSINPEAPVLWHSWGWSYHWAWLRFLGCGRNSESSLLTVREASHRTNSEMSEICTVCLSTCLPLSGQWTSCFPGPSKLLLVVVLKVANRLTLK